VRRGSRSIASRTARIEPGHDSGRPAHDWNRRRPPRSPSQPRFGMPAGSTHRNSWWSLRVLVRGRVLTSSRSPALTDQGLHQDQPITARQRQHRLTQAEMVAVAQGYRAGASMKQLAREFETHRTTIGSVWTSWASLSVSRDCETKDLASAVVQYETGWSLSRLVDHFRCDAGTVRKELGLAGCARCGSPGSECREPSSAGPSPALPR
jgi:hypothetical protein